jgi:ABC-2 type transport system permease protein
MKANTRFFNTRLYVEGLKRLRVLGIGLLVLVLIASILVPTVYWILEADYDPNLNRPPHVFDRGESYVLCVPILVFSATTPIFFLVLFSYLFKRRESDFYHSIPYTRTCVYTSFVAAALTWIVGITVICATAAGLIWAICPYVIFDVSGLVVLVLISLAASVYICGFMMLAIALCGNLTTVLLNFTLFALLPRAIAVMLGMIFDNQLFIINIYKFFGGFFDFNWWLPAQICCYQNRISNTLPTVAALSAGLGALLLALSCYLYHKRPSQMAGNAAQGPRAQHWLRCLFTLPFALVLVTDVLIEFPHPEFVIVLVLAIVILVVYYLYELITTKSFRCLLRATPWLSVVLAGCILFTGCYFAIFAGIVYPKTDADEIESVSSFLDPRYFAPVDYGSYEYMRFEACRFEDEEIRELIATGLLTAQRIERGEQKLDKHAEVYHVDVKIHLKNGLTLDRTLLLYRSELEALNEILQYHEKTQEALYTMPPEESVDDILLASYHGLSTINDQQKQEFVTIFRREYEAASKAFKEHALDIPNTYKERQGNFVLTINGKIDGEFYSSRYYITHAFPESYAFLKQYETDPSYPETEYETQYDKEYDGELITIETTYNE